MDKNRLRRYQAIVRERDQLGQQIAALVDTLEAPKTAKLSSTPEGSKPEGSALESLVVKKLELVALYQAKQAELIEEQVAIEHAIDSLEPTARTLLRYKYIKGLKWEDICERMAYSWRQIHRLHGNALAALKAKEEKEQTI